MDRYRMMPNYHYYDAEGVSPLTIGKSIGKPLRDLKIYGESVQAGTPTPEAPVEIQSCGDKTKNLFDKNNIGKNGGYLNETGEAVVSGGWYHTDYIEVNSEVITISSISNGAEPSICAYDENKNFILGEKYASKTTITVKASNMKYVRFSYTSIAKLNLIQIEAGDTATEYEPYGYKIPIEVGGKNLLDINSIKLSSPAVKNLIITGNSFSFEVVTAPSSAGASIENIWLQKGTYIMRGICSNTSGNTCGFAVIKNGAFVHNFAGNGINQKFTISESGEYRITFYKSYSDPVGNVTTFSNIQLELGSSATAYEPYVEPEIYNIYLNEPLRKIGSRADYVDFKRGKVVRRNKSAKLYANKWVTYKNLGSIRAYRASSIFPDSDKSGTYNTANKCNMFKYLNGGEISAVTEADGEWLALRQGTVYLAINVDNLSEVTEGAATEYINSLNAEVIYQLATPTEEDISLPETNTNKGTDIITVGTTIPPSNIAVQYYK